ncbi:inorganic phosphate transporter [Thraustotheca clavata]|uniref:Inorganic phosphate transporter n=1 Tax=Thraustotheca clavata TaxID=74557 RepID=A0A1W0ABR1_9STRA|nr:inorganic phosphate transporter [Thraustotheca clavata]
MVNKFLLRGLGFFNDAYDLSVINIINVILQDQYTKGVYTAQMKSNVSSAALIGAVLGQLTFGFLGDMYGRKSCMVATCVILIVGGILCAAAYGGSAVNTLWFLFVARGILGFGIGGEYPLAAASSSEDATSTADRNRRVALTFSLQGVGFIFAGLMGLLMVSVLDETKTQLEIMWRVLFGVGVLPALFLVYFRITAEEPEAYKTMLTEEVHLRTVRWTFILKHYGRSLVGTAGTWFLFDIVFYAQNLFTASILSVVGAKSTLRTIALQNVLISLVALPGYYVAVFFINRMGRKNIMLMGLTLMTIIFLVLGIGWHSISGNATVFIILFGLTLFFSNFGPNMSTFVMPTEMYPTAIKSTCHGFSAAMGKAGASVGSYGFALWVDNPSFGYIGTWYTFAGISLLALIVTWFCMFDHNGESSELDNEFKALLAQEDMETRKSFSHDTYAIEATPHVQRV